MQEVAHRVYIETRYPGPTLGLAILPRGMVLVDAPPCPDAAQSWQHTVRAMNGSVPDRVLVFLDAHPDRILGGQVMVGTQIMHENAYRWLMENETTLLGREPQGAAWEQCPTAVTPEWPRHAITFTERMVLYLGDLPVLLHHKPGHRPGAVWVEVPHVRVLFVGDAVVLREPPFLAEADLPAWMRRLDELQEHYGDYVVIGGRDGVLNLPDALQTMRERLEVWHEAMRRWARRGWTWAAAVQEAETWLSLWPAASRKEQVWFRQRWLSGLATCYRKHYLGPKQARRRSQRG